LELGQHKKENPLSRLGMIEGVEKGDYYFIIIILFELTIIKSKGYLFFTAGY